MRSMRTGVGHLTACKLFQAQNPWKGRVIQFSTALFGVRAACRRFPRRQQSGTVSRQRHPALVSGGIGSQPRQWWAPAFTAGPAAGERGKRRQAARTPKGLARATKRPREERREGSEDKRDECNSDVASQCLLSWRRGNVEPPESRGLRSRRGIAC